MKYILLLIFVISSLLSNEEKQKITIGAGSYFQTQPYAGVNTIVLPSPVVFFDNDLFYVRWSRAGVYFLGDKTQDFSWGLSFTVQPRVYGYDSNDIQGMDKRENTWEGGLAFSAKKGDAYIEVMALNDLLNKYDSWILKSEIGYDIKYGKFSFYPSVIVSYQSKKFVDYYYGVTQKEATARGENTYTPGAGIQLGLQTYVKYPLTKKLSALVNVRADRLPSEAHSSSIVNNKYIYSGLASLIYTFYY